jgi:uncharacterized protein (DUF697 family)
LPGEKKPVLTAHKLSDPEIPVSSAQEATALPTDVNPLSSDHTTEVYAQLLPDADQMIKDADQVIKQDAQRKRDAGANRKRVHEARWILEAQRRHLAQQDPQISASDDEIKWHAGYAAAAALLPPGLDLATIAGVQLKMLFDISKKFNIEFSEERGKAIIGALAGTLGSGGLNVPVTSMIKAIPVLGHAAGTIGLAGLAYSATYALGRIFTAHYASGGNLLNFDPVAAKEAYRRGVEAHRALA